MDYSVPQPIPQGMLPMAPVKDGKPPKHRLEKASDAQTIVSNLWQANLRRFIEDAAMQAQIDGNPPYSPAKLRQQGRASDPNFNTLEAKAIQSAALVPYFDLFAGGNRYVDVKLAPPGQGVNVISDRLEYDPKDMMGYDTNRLSQDSGIVSEEFDQLLRRWPDFEQVMHTGLTDFVTWGRCHFSWRADNSWQFDRIPYHRVIAPDSTPLAPQRQELFVVLQDFSVSELYAKIRDRSAAESAGWDYAATMDAIQSAVPIDPQVPEDPVAIQQQVRDSDIYVSARSASVRVATIFVKEFSGKWSELMIRRDQIPGGSNPTDLTSDPKYLFKAWDRHESLGEAMNSMFFEVTGGTFQSVSGLARDIFALMQIKDRIACAQVWGLFLRNSLVLQPRTANDSVRQNLLQLGAMSFVPAGMEVLNSQILGDISSTIEVSREMSNMVERNTGIYRPTLEKTSGNPDTLGEFQMKFAQATVLSTSGINRFYSQLDRLYYQQYRRIVKLGIKKSATTDYERAAKYFVECCKSRGVSEDQLKRVQSVRAFRNIGQGSLAMRQQMAAAFLSPNVFPLFPANGQQNILEDFTRVMGSQASVERYMPDADRKQLPNDQVELALLENGVIRIGAPVTWTPSQNNIIHAQTHLQAGAQAAATLQQGSDPMEIVGFLDGIGAHVAVHLQREAQNPMSKQAVKILSQQWKQLAQVTDKIKQKIQASSGQQQERQEEAQELLTEQQIKRLEVLLKNQISREKAQGMLALKKERQDADIALSARQQQIDQGLQIQQTATDNAIADAEAAADIQRQGAKTAAEVEMAKKKASSKSELAPA